jgi:signal transduction histidine kinase
VTPIELDNPTLAEVGPKVSIDGNPRHAELVELVRAYTEVTDRLEQSHRVLTGEVTRLQRELASANQALQRSKRLAALGEMAAGIAHEIRNPLASIQLYARMLTEDLVDRPVEHDVAVKIASAVRGLEGIVKDVLTFSREMKIRRVDGSVHDLFERAIEAVQPMADELDVSVEMAGEDRLLSHDGDLLHQAMVNLIRNAVEAAGEAGGGRVTTSVTERDGNIELSVRDTGSGIADDAIDRIFNPFFTTRATGTGLGLAIVHRIVDAHGGTIAVHNDRGAVFTITIPQDDERGS